MEETVSPNRVTVVIPTYNERDNISRLVPELLRLGDHYAVVVVDDNSPDGTGDVLDRLAREYPDRGSVLHRASKEGIGPAYIAGFAIALAGTADLVAQMDADHSHNPADLTRLVDAAADADVVVGSRYVRGGGTIGWPRHRLLISRVGGWYARRVLGVPVVDLTSGFKVFRRVALEGLDLLTVRSDGYSFQIELSYRALQRGMRVIEVPIVFTDRIAGTSKLSRWIVFEALIAVWRMRLRGWRQP